MCSLLVFMKLPHSLCFYGGKIVPYWIPVTFKQYFLALCISHFSGISKIYETTYFGHAENIFIMIFMYYLLQRNLVLKEDFLDFSLTQLSDIHNRCTLNTNPLLYISQCILFVCLHCHFPKYLILS